MKKKFEFLQNPLDYASFDGLSEGLAELLCVLLGNGVASSFYLARNLVFLPCNTVNCNGP